VLLFVDDGGVKEVLQDVSNIPVRVSIHKCVCVCA